MKFDRKSPKFLTDLITMILAIIVIVLTIVVIIGGSETLLAIVLYIGAAMFISNIVRGFISRKYSIAIFLVPAALCVVGGLMAQGVIGLWSF